MEMNDKIVYNSIENTSKQEHDIEVDRDLSPIKKGILSRKTENGDTKSKTMLDSKLSMISSDDIKKELHANKPNQNRSGPDSLFDKADNSYISQKNNQDNADSFW